jgi:DNA-binding PadR family transcriptional regulator
MTPIDFNGLDTAIHGPIRLGVLTCLQTDGPLGFTELKRRLGATDGALGTHLLKLEEAGYVVCEKVFVGRRPRSTYRLTPAGRRAFGNYLDALRKVIDAVEQARQTKRTDH